MKNYKLLWGASAIVLAGAIAVPMAMDNAQKYVPRDPSTTSEKQKGIKGAEEWLFNIRKNQVTGTIDFADVLKAQEQARMFSQMRGASAAPNLVWQELGPDNVGGRTRALLIDKDNENKMYAGGVGGGLWISTDGGALWSKYSDQLENLAVSAICQAANGDIYFGTGEGLYGQWGFGAGSFVGGGIWKSSDGGQTFTRLSSTVPSSVNPSAAFAAVNAMAADRNDPMKIYAATNQGIRMSIDGGATWTNPVTLSTTSTSPLVGEGTDVEVAPDGSYVIGVINKKVYKSATGATQTWDVISQGGANELPTAGLSRTEVTIAPDDANFIYASCANGTRRLYNIYLSTDAGATWKVIGPGQSTSTNPSFDPFWNGQGQGDYDNAIAVAPGNKYKVILGGVELWKWEGTVADPFIGQWTRIALEGPDVPQNPYYVHADKHVIVFKKSSPNIFYVGCDGGVFKTIDGGQTFFPSNRGYNVTQFYSVAFKSWNMDNGGNVGNIVMGGAQDNGTQYINGNGNTIQSAVEVSGGDGAYCEMSMLNNNAIFSSVYYGAVYRSANDGSSMASFYTARPAALEAAGSASFVTPIALWESRYDLGSPDSVLVIATSNMPAGTTDTVPSNTNGLSIIYTTPVAISQGDTFMVQDYYQSKLAVGFTSAVFMTRGALDFGGTPEWTKIAGANSKPNAFSGTVQTLEWTPDGDNLYVGTDAGKLYRISNIRMAIDSTNNGDIDSLGGPNTQTPLTCTQIANFPGRAVTSIAVDPNGNKLVVTLGNYGNTAYVYYCADALNAPASTSTTNFVNKTTGLPAMPVYSSVFDKWNPNRVVIGTEMGIYATDNITTTPAWDNTTSATNFPNVAVFMLRQQQAPAWEANNSGYIYAATHGRGIWRTNNNLVTTGIEEPSSANNNSSVSVVVSPNPMTEKALVAFTLKQSGSVTLKVYDLRGKLVRTVKQNASAGVVQIELEADGLNAGTYLVSIEAGAQAGTAKFVVVK
jgi:photosystem II stability/assembly factor-like uncharacterized protein